MKETEKQREDRLWPKWLDRCSQPEVVRLFHQEQMSQQSALFLETIKVLEEKIELEGTAFFSVPRSDYVDCRLPLNLRSHSYGKYQISVAMSKEISGFFVKIVILTTPVDPEFRIDSFTDFVYIAKAWNPDRGGYEYTFNRRTLVFDLEKLGNTSLNIVEPNPPSTRAWFVEGAAISLDDVDIEYNLKEILNAIPTWTPAPRGPAGPGPAGGW